MTNGVRSEAVSRRLRGLLVTMLDLCFVSDPTTRREESVE